MRTQFGQRVMDFPLSSPGLRRAPNFRDVGGLSAADGKVIRFGRLFRSDMISRPHDDDLETLKRCGIGLVLDLRSSSESGATPNSFWVGQGAEVIAFDVGTDVRARGSFWEQLRADGRPQQVLALMHRIYRSIPLAVAPALTILFNRLADGAPPALLHCSAGKDRTGVAVALLLHALGVPREAIETDYLETSSRITRRVVTNARKMFAEIAGAPLSDESLQLLTHVRADYLEQAYSRLERKFGGIDKFLAIHAGLDSGKRKAMRDRLLM